MFPNLVKDFQLEDFLHIDVPTGKRFYPILPHLWYGKTSMLNLMESILLMIKFNGEMKQVILP